MKLWSFRVEQRLSPKAMPLQEPRDLFGLLKLFPTAVFQKSEVFAQPTFPVTIQPVIFVLQNTYLQVMFRIHKPWRE